jgi:hypothetical protein
MTKTASRPPILAVLGGLLLAGAGSVGGASGDLLWTAEDRSAIAACTSLAAGNGSVLAYSWMRDDSSAPLRPRLRAVDLADGDLLWQVDDPPWVLSVEKEGNTNYYTPVLPKKKGLQAEIGLFLDEVVGGDREALELVRAAVERKLRKKQSPPSAGLSTPTDVPTRSATQ